MTAEQIIEELERKITSLERENERLETENRKLTNELYEAKMTIRTELEPRIKREKRAYDNYITDPERW